MTAPIPAGDPAGATVDGELAAMARIVDALGDLDDGARERVMRWANDRFFPGPTPDVRNAITGGPRRK